MAYGYLKGETGVHWLLCGLARSTSNTNDSETEEHDAKITYCSKNNIEM
jgi:hypothetical protein